MNLFKTTASYLAMVKKTKKQKAVLEISDTDLLDLSSEHYNTSKSISNNKERESHPSSKSLSKILEKVSPINRESSSFRLIDKDGRIDLTNNQNIKIKNTNPQKSEPSSGVNLPFLNNPPNNDMIEKRKLIDLIKCFDLYIKNLDDYHEQFSNYKYKADELLDKNNEHMKLFDQIDNRIKKIESRQLELEVKTLQINKATLK